MFLGASATHACGRTPDSNAATHRLHPASIGISWVTLQIPWCFHPLVAHRNTGEVTVPSMWPGQI